MSLAAKALALQAHQDDLLYCLLLVAGWGGGGGVLLYACLPQEVRSAGRFLFGSNLLVGSFTLRTLRHGSNLEYFVVSPVEFIVGEMRIALRDLDAGMPGKFLCQFEISGSAQNGGHEIMTK